MQKVSTNRNQNENILPYKITVVTIIKLLINLLSKYKVPSAIDSNLRHLKTQIIVHSCSLHKDRGEISISLHDEIVHAFTTQHW